MLIPLAKPEISLEEKEAVLRVLKSGQYVKGEENESFGQEFAEFCGARYGVTASSGSSALYLALMAAGIGKEDEVITVANTFVATVEAILLCGAKPRLIDVDGATHTIDTQLMRKAINRKTKAIIPVHLYGHPSNMKEITEIAQKKRITVIEDAAQAHGAKAHGKIIGSISDFTCFSFYPSKNMTVAGEGGMVTTNTEGHFRLLKLLRDHGRTSRYSHELVGFNYRMSETQAAIGRVQLKKVGKWNASRRKIANIYSSRLNGVTVPTEADWAHSVYHLYVVGSTERDELRKWLEKKGIATGVHYPIPVHKQPGYKALFRDLRLPVTEKLSKEVLSIPIFPTMTKNQIDRVVDAVNCFRGK